MKNYEDLELRDDFVFGKVLSDPIICKRMLEILLNHSIDEIRYPETQKEIDIEYSGKSVRLDVYVQDADGPINNMEMQNLNGQSEAVMSLPKRSRYYQGIIDLNELDKGDDFSDLNDSIIIFICTFDPFDEGKYCYTFENICRENAQSLGDGTTKIFFNTKGNLTEAPEAVRELFSYIEHHTVSGDFTAAIEKKVESIKKNTDYRREYMKSRTWLWEARTAAKAEGLAEGRAEGEERFGRLVQLLTLADRKEDILKVSADAEYRKQLFAEFHL